MATVPELKIKGPLHVHSATTIDAALSVTTTITAAGSSAAVAWQDRTTTANSWRWYSTGNVTRLSSTIGATTTDQLTIDGSGNLTATSNVTAYSDERLKTNWHGFGPDFVERLAMVKSGVYDRTDINLTQVGVSAQSLQAVMPEAVTEGVDELLTVAYGNAALAACVELAKEVVALRAEVQTLKAKQ